MAVKGLPRAAVGVSAGGRHACALTDDGGVACWGANGYGQLGALGSGASAAPLEVTTLTGHVLSVSAGVYHTCALTTGSEIVCWGSNFFGQLGNGAQFESPLPLTVTALSEKAATVSSGEGHTCALLDTGQIDCWGWNHLSQLGDGSTIDRSLAAPVGDLPAAVALAAGGRHSCALLAQPNAGAVECWGANGHGQLGGPTSANSPVPVDNLTADAVAIAAGAQHTCALTSDSRVDCWGANNRGQLGTGVPSDGSGVGLVSALPDAVAVDAGAFHTCAVTDAAGIDCWGANDYGQLGDGTTRDRPLPTAVHGLPGKIAAVSGGGSHTCALTTAGEVLCWGANNNGQLGNGTLADNREPVPVQRLPNAVAIDTGSHHTCALTNSGDVFCWGANDWGQLGDGTHTTRTSPTRVTSLAGNATTLSLGDEHSCATLRSGDIQCWGLNYFGQLGDGKAPFSGSPTPVHVLGLGTDG